MVGSIRRFQNKLSDKFKEARLVITLYDRKGNMFGAAGRSLKENAAMRYITILFDETKPKIFGLEKVNFKERYYAVEGQLDSLFLDNAIAMSGADFDVSHLENTENMVVVYDNEPRNPEIVKRLERRIEEGYRVVIWPNYVEDKDNNNMVLAGHSDIEAIMKRNSYKGLMARLKLKEWRRI